MTVEHLSTWNWTELKKHNLFVSILHLLHIINTWSTFEDLLNRFYLFYLWDTNKNKKEMSLGHGNVNTNLPALSNLPNRGKTGQMTCPKMQLCLSG